jgi:hypothetical protein
LRAMLYSLSKQIVHCHIRADECRKLAALSQDESDRKFHTNPEESRIVEATTTVEFALCVCPNCGRVRDQIVTKPRL